MKIKDGSIALNVFQTSSGWHWAAQLSGYVLNPSDRPFKTMLDAIIDYETKRVGSDWCVHSALATRKVTHRAVQRMEIAL